MTKAINHYATQRYYPTSYTGGEPPHEVRNWCYVRKIIRALRRGETIHPILMQGDFSGGAVLLTGTHRTAANDVIEMLHNAGRLAEKPRYVRYVDPSDIEDADDLHEAIEQGDGDAIDSIWDRNPERWAPQL